MRSVWLVVALTGVAMFLIWREKRKWKTVDAILRYGRTSLQCGFSQTSTGAEVVAWARERNVEREVVALWEVELQEWNALVEKGHEE